MAGKVVVINGHQVTKYASLTLSMDTNQAFDLIVTDSEEIKLLLNKFKGVDEFIIDLYEDQEMRKPYAKVKGKAEKGILLNMGNARRAKEGHPKELRLLLEGVVEFN